MASTSLSRPRPAINPWLIAISVMMGTFMEVLDTTVVNVSLPHIAGNLGATVDEATWVLTSYLVSNAIILPMTGWLASRFGRKRVLITAIAGFTGASVMCALSPNLQSLLFFRIVQGATGGGMVPLSQAIMLEAFPVEKRGRAMAFYALGIVVAPMIGPVLGGWITDSYSWRWLFYINVPVGIIGILMSQAFVFDPPYLKRTKGKIDYWGIGLLTVGMGALQIMLDKGQEKDWFTSHFIVILAILTAAGLGVFLINELIRAHPVVDLSVFRNGTYATGVFLMTTLGFVMYGSTVLIPIFLQTLLGYSAMDSGMVMLPRGMGAFLVMPVVGILTAKIEARKLLIVGLSVSSISLWLLARINLNAGYWDLFWPQIIQGMSMGFVFVPLTTATHNPISREKMGNATSTFNLMRNVGGSIGIAAVTTIVARTTQRNINILGRNITPYSVATGSLMRNALALFSGKGSPPGVAETQAYGAVVGMVDRQAAMLANIYAFRLLSIIFACTIPLVFIMRKPRTGSDGSAAMH
jgi:DHA2 family multidrug resistance protein